MKGFFISYSYHQYLNVGCDKLAGAQSLFDNALSDVWNSLDYVFSKQISEPEASPLDLKVIFSLFSSTSTCCYFWDKGMSLKS